MIAFSLLCFCATLVRGMTNDEIKTLRQDTRNLFYHGYTNYMTHAFPEDELKPISCVPQTRNRENPADIGLNDVLGNYSLTLIDSLSTLAILASGEGNDDRHDSLQDFKDGIEALVELYGAADELKPCGSKACGFDLDSKVQVFETNIRGVGGLLSAHLFAVGDLPIRGYTPKWMQGEDGRDYIQWDNYRYDGQLLRLALDLATRLLPAFDTPTGLPYPRVNLRYGAAFYQDPEGVCNADGSSSGSKESTETCAAGAGSLVLEFSTLSRLVGDDLFEKLAKKAFWAVWDRRSTIGLIGNGIDAESGQWTLPALSGIGAGIDSFYEYALKSSILLSGLPYDVDEENAHNPDAFLDTWQKAHAAVKHHVYRSSLAEKHPYYGQTDQFTGAPRYSWIDNLSAYYPGLLTLAGELDEAIESHRIFAALWTRYAALPERWLAPNAFIDPNFKHWAGRPEFIESTFYLYQATKDPFYLHTGEMVLRDIRRRCWTQCGWTDLSDVLTGEKRDRMESFFLGETAKYLYLLFEENHPLNRLDAPVVFTTEGHPLVVPSRLRQHKQSQAATPRSKSTPVCPVPPPPLPLTVSNVVDRPDFFHAALLAQLHMVPVQPARASALLESSEDRPGISLSDVRSPTNYTYFPWTLPQTLVPALGFSAAKKYPTTSTLTFPNLNTAGVDGERPSTTIGGMHKFLDGILLSSLSNIRLNMVQESKAILLRSPDGILFEQDVGPQYRVHGVANWALGRDEKVVLTKEAMDGVAPGDPNFRRVKDLEMIDIVLDYPLAISTANGSASSSSDDNSDTLRSAQSLLDQAEALLLGLLISDEEQSAVPTTSSNPLRTTLPAILPTGIGAAPLSAHLDAADIANAAPGNLPLTSIYYLDDTLCPPRKLPGSIARNNQVLILKRGDCSFSEKLTTIPSFVPSEDALQLVVVLSVPNARSSEEAADAALNSGKGDKMIRPLLEEKQTTPSGLERRYGIPMAMVNGSPDVVAALEAAAMTIAWYDKDGVLQEQHQERLASGLGIKRRYWFESMGIPIGNLFAL
ncbi:hypothetical protein AMS68_004256 [Peltaster fructicola]|uniref:alpha-1,2-Mannosidase n=1 Tax=Peltaster fructicola TaxID=286661 RepID=A0A6H0XVU2_9PEZI|nr:hypothetical protein AMS68_004256 [Peltaster fructicola]